jgi:hypothetical protein
MPSFLVRSSRLALVFDLGPGTDVHEEIPTASIVKGMRAFIRPALRPTRLVAASAFVDVAM